MAVVEGGFRDRVAASQGSIVIESIIFGEPRQILAIEATVPAGFPSPAADFVEGRIDLQDVLVPHPSASFTVRVSGWSMQRAGIHDQDLAIVDRSLTAKHDDIVIAVLDGSLTIKRLLKRSGRVVLAPDSDDPTYRAVDITGRDDVEIWGVFTGRRDDQDSALFNKARPMGTVAYTRQRPNRRAASETDGRPYLPKVATPTNRQVLMGALPPPLEAAPPGYLNKVHGCLSQGLEGQCSLSKYPNLFIGRLENSGRLSGTI